MVVDVTPLSNQIRYADTLADNAHFKNYDEILRRPLVSYRTA